MPEKGTYDYLALERVVYGRPAAEVVAEEAERRGAERVFIVSTRSLTRKTDAVRGIEAALEARFAGLFDGCVAHTPRESVIEAAAAARAARPDLIVTVGGGTVIDTVKAVLVCLAAGVESAEELGEYRIRLDEEGRPRIPDVPAPPVRQIVVPTTLSGAEFSDLAGVTDRRRGIKDGYGGRRIGAAAVILDPGITRHTPEWLWLSTGFRSIDHAVETVCSAAPHPLADATALHALKMFSRSLPKNRAEPEDLQGRLDSQMAVWLATTGLNRVPYGASHGIGHQLGAVCGVPHGYTSCVMLPAVLRYNREVTAERQAWIADALGRPGEEAADAVAALAAALGLPGTLREVGVRREQFRTIAEGCMENRMVRANPRPITRPEDVLEILEMAW